MSEKYYMRLKELINEDNLYTFSIEGRRVSQEEFYKHLKKIYEEKKTEEKKTHADTV